MYLLFSHLIARNAIEQLQEFLHFLRRGRFTGDHMITVGRISCHSREIGDDWCLADVAYAGFY